MPLQRYSVFSLIRQGLTGHREWQPAWRQAEPKPDYDAIIIGGGGHGLATAYYLAKEHSMSRVAVLERGWLGGGNVARNTTIVRSNYFLDQNARFYEFSLKLWERLATDLNYNLMFSQRGVLNLAHSDRQMEDYRSRGNAMRVNGVDAEILDRAQVARMVPGLNLSPRARYPIVGGLLQARGGTARHDAVAWGFARAADARGVDIIENCEVTGIRRDGGRVAGVETSRGFIAARKVAFAVSGHSGRLAEMAGFRLPIETHVLQAWVSEPIKPVLHCVATYGAGHFYVSQTDKGEFCMGSDLDGYNTYARRGGLPVLEHACAIFLDMFPQFARLRMMRSWAGIVDMTMDGSPIVGKTPVEGLYMNAGWCYGGFKATPGSGWVFAHTIAKDEPHELNAAFDLDRFARGDTLDERGAGPVPAHH